MPPQQPALMPPSTARLLTQTGCEAHMGNAINNEKKKGKLRFMMISDL